MITKKLFLIGFLSGVVACALVTWLFVFRYPPLLSEDAKVSYMLGHQMGGGIMSRAPGADISSNIVASAMRDVVNEKSRLTAEEMYALRQQVMERRSAQRGHGDRPPGDRPDRNQKDENGFFKPRPDVRFKFLDESKAGLKNLSEIQPTAERIEEYRYQLTILDPSRKEISKKSFSGSRRELPRSLNLVLDFLKDSEKAEIYIHGRELMDIKRLNPSVASVLTEDYPMIIQRLKSK